MSSLLLTHIKSFYLYQWLIRLKTIESLNQSELEIFFDKDLSKQAMLNNLNFLEVIADLAIRNSDNKMFPKQTGESDLDALPTIRDDYLFVVNQYINESETENFVVNMQRSPFLSMSAFMYEQVKYITPVINELGRIAVLFKDTFGLEPEQIVFILIMLNSIQKETRGIFNIKTDQHMRILYDCNICTWDDLNKFFSVFSISVRDYRMLAKDRGISKHTKKCQRIISEYPILKNYISLDNHELYYIPLSNLLIYSISKTLFPKIYSIQEKSRFKSKFGNYFEDYVRDMCLHSFGADKLVECSKIIKEEGKNIAEFQLNIDKETVLIVEAKAVYINEKYIIDSNIDKLNRAIENDLRKAYKQIHSCFNHIEFKEKFGIIVIMSYLPGLSSLAEHFKQKGFEYTSDNIVIMSIQEFEVLIGNSPEIIKTTLSKIRDAEAFQKSNIVIEIGANEGNLINPYLQSEYHKITKGFEEVIRNFTEADKNVN